MSQDEGHRIRAPSNHADEHANRNPGKPTSMKRSPHPTPELRPATNVRATRRAHSRVGALQQCCDFVTIVGKGIAADLNGNDRASVPIKGDLMTVIVVLIVLAALVFGGIGLFVEAAAWALFIAVALIVIGAIAGFTGRGRSRTV